MPHATHPLPNPGLQALILCGPGVSLNTFTSNPADLPKCLLPIANRPMVWYPLDWCYRAGITDITLITPPESEAALESALATNPALTSLPSPRPEVLAPKDLTLTTGTGELLRLPEVQKVIESDFVVLPCDLVCEVDGTQVVKEWLTLNPLSASKKRNGGLSIFYPAYGLEGISNKKDETDFLATVPLSPVRNVPAPTGSLRPDIEEVVTVMPTDTLNDKLEADKGFLRLRQSLLKKHGRVKIRTRHRDAGVYVFPRWVKDFVAANERFDSLSEDVLGWWAKAGWQEGLMEKLGLNAVLGGKTARAEDVNGKVDGHVDPAELSSTRISRPLDQPATQAFATRVGAPASDQRTADIPPLLAYVQPAPTASSPQPLIRRVDTTAQLLSISLHLAKYSPVIAPPTPPAPIGSTRNAPHQLQPPPPTPLSHDHKIHPSARLEQQARVSAEDCLIAENVTIGSRANIKECIVGANCDIGRNVRLTRCLLMEGVVVGEGVVMSGCVVGRRARVEGVKPAAAAEDEGGNKGKGKGKVKDEEDERTKLTDCEVAPGFVVETGTEAKGEKFMEGFEDGEGLEGEDVGGELAEDGEAED